MRNSIILFKKQHFPTLQTISDLDSQNIISRTNSAVIPVCRVPDGRMGSMWLNTINQGSHFLTEDIKNLQKDVCGTLKTVADGSAVVKGIGVVLVQGES